MELRQHSLCIPSSQLLLLLLYVEREVEQEVLQEDSEVNADDGNIHLSGYIPGGYSSSLNSTSE